MSRSRGIGALLPPSTNPSRQGRGKLRSEHGPDFGVRSRPRGFTVIEMVVALAIVAVMTAITVPIGINWMADYRFSMAARSLSNSVLMARMRGIENRAIFTIKSSKAITGDAPFSAACPGIEFTTNVDHGLSPPNPAVAGALVQPGPAIPLPTFWSPVAPCRCVKSLASATPTTPGDMVMISGLDQTRFMNGSEFEVITTDPTKNTFTVQHTLSTNPDNISGVNGPGGTVRNLTAPGRLRIVPAESTATPDLTATPDQAAYNFESFTTSAYTIKEEASSIVFRYDKTKFQVTFHPGNPAADPLPGTLLDPADLSKNFAEIRFDNRGFPKSTVVGNGVPNPTAANTTILIAENTTKAPRQVQYLISTTGKVNTLAWEN